MRLSTSSSNDRLPDGSWGRIWGVVMALVIVGIAASEVVHRSRGQVSSVRDSQALWALARAAVDMDDPDEVVLIGSSRIHLAINLASFEDEFGRLPVQLAVGGSFADPVLKDLAESGFRGTVIYSLTPFRFQISNDGTTGLQAEYVRAYHARHADFAIEQRLRNGLEGALVSLPGPDYIQTLPSRERRADYQAVDIEEARAHRYGRLNATLTPLDESALQVELGRMNGWIDMIQAAGGRVIIVRMPSSDRVLAFENEHIPRDRYWDVLASQTSAATIHFQDEPELQGFECPEGSHLDYRDADRFTRALVRVINRRLE